MAHTAPDRGEEHRERPLKGREKRVLALLGLPTFALALGITAVTTYAPLLARRYTSSTTIIGVIIAAEGLVALVVPITAGAWSDQLRTRVGGRLPFIVAGAPVIAATMILRKRQESTCEMRWPGEQAMQGRRTEAVAALPRGPRTPQRAAHPVISATGCS